MARTPFTCPRCSRKIGVPAKLVGRWISCPHCGMEFAALRDEPAASADAASGSDLDGPVEVQEESHRPPAVLFGLLALIVLAVGALIAVVMVANRSRPRQEAKAQPAPATARSDTSRQRSASRPVGRPAPRTGDTRDDIDADAALVGARAFHTVASAVTFWVVFWIILGTLYLVGVILTLAWVARDARNRGVDGAAVWVIAILLSHWVGLLVYLAARPAGTLGVCDRCSNKRLEYAKVCPHCGHA
jgi:hypothetical protein